MRQLLIVLPALALASCGYAESGSSDSTATATRSFPLSGFEQVALRGSDDVHVVIGKTFSVSATGPQSELDKLEIEVDGDTLKVGRKSSSAWHIGWSRKDIRGVVVTVTMPSIRGAKLAGSGDMRMDSVNAEQFRGALAGSGDLRIGNVQAKAIELDLAGSGDIEISGKTETLRIKGVGSGDIRAGTLEAEQANISLAGSGNVSARATGEAKVSLMGSGDVEISGTSRCKTSKMGSGTVTCTG